MIPRPIVGELEPLRADRLGGLRFLLHSRFTSTTLEQHLAVNPGLSWRHRGNGQYVVGGYWRRRPEIAHVVELSPGPHRRLLVEQLVSAGRTIGLELVLAEIPIGDLDFWRAADFAPVERIVEYEKLGTDARVAPPAVPLRRYDGDDLPRLLELERRTFPWLWWNSTPEMALYAEAPQSELWVATAPDDVERLDGYVGITIRGAQGHLDRLAVDPDRRRRGIGAALVALALDRYGRAGVKRISLTTQVDNARAQPLYERFGFRPTRNQLTIYGRWLARPRDRTP